MSTQQTSTLAACYTCGTVRGRSGMVRGNGSLFCSESCAERDQPDSPAYCETHGQARSICECPYEDERPCKACEQAYDDCGVAGHGLFQCCDLCNHGVIPD